MAGAPKKRRSRATGVGRGNGEGSRVSQFKEGEPSRHPQGRPRKEATPVDIDLRSVIRRQLATPVAVRQNGISTMVPQGEALVSLMLANCRNAKPREQLAIMKFLIEQAKLSSDEAEMRNMDIPPQSIADFINGLTKALDEEEADLPGEAENSFH
jgi:hypothetical protein